MIERFLNKKFYSYDVDDIFWMQDHIISEYEGDIKPLKTDREDMIEQSDGEIPLLTLEYDQTGNLFLAWCSTTLKSVTCEGCGGHECKDYEFVWIKNYIRTLKLNRIKDGKDTN